MGRPNLKIQFICIQCATKFYWSPSRLKTNQPMFCKRLCFQTWQKNHKQKRIDIVHRYENKTRLPNGGLPKAKAKYHNNRFFGGNRENVLERDGYQCVECKVKASIVHHKDRNRGNNDLSNLLTLCRACHAREHLRDRVPDNQGRFTRGKVSIWV